MFGLLSIFTKLTLAVSVGLEPCPEVREEDRVMAFATLSDVREPEILRNELKKIAEITVNCTRPDSLEYVQERLWLAIMLHLVGEQSLAIATFHTAQGIASRINDVAGNIKASRWLGEIYFEIGDLGHAMEEARYAEGMTRKAFGSQHPDLIPILLVRARILDAIHDFSAVGLFEEARRIAIANNHGTLPDVEYLLGVHYMRWTEDRLENVHGEGKRLLKKALSQFLREADLKINREMGRSDLFQLRVGQVYLALGQLAKAEVWLNRALQTQSGWSVEPRSVGETLEALGVLNKMKNRKKTAAEMFQKSLAASMSAFGPYNPRSVDVLEQLATLAMDEGDLNGALRYLTQADDAIYRYESVKNLLLGALYGNGLQIWLDKSYTTDRALGLALDSAADNPLAARFALQALMRWESTYEYVDSRTNRKLQKPTTFIETAVAERLSESRSKLANLLIRNPENAGGEVVYWMEEISNLEAEAKRRVIQEIGSEEALTLDRVYRALPPQSALLHYAEYTPKKDGATQIAAFVLSADGSVHGANLGEKDRIASSIKEFIKGVRKKESETTLVPKARSIAKLIYDPVALYLNGASRVFVVPTGALATVPFAALVDSEDKYLLEHWPIILLPSGRSLIELGAPPPKPRSAPIIFADPDYGGPSGAQPENRGIYIEEVNKETSATQAISKMHFQRISGTQREASALSAIVPGVTVMLGAEASEGKS